MVTVGRVGFERKLNSIASVLSNTSKKYPLLGLVQNGSIFIWQDGDMPIWNIEKVDTDENFTFSVLITKLKEIVGGFKGESVDLLSDGRGALIIKSGRSKVKVPYMEGLYNDIPSLPSLDISCSTDSKFLDFLSKSSNFISKTFEQASLTYSYIGSKDNQFLITGMNGFCSFTASIQYDGDSLPDIVVPAEFSEAVARLLGGGNGVEIGLAMNQGHVIMSNGNTTIYTPRIPQTYPPVVYDLASHIGVPIFDADRKSMLEQLKLALQTTDRNLVGIEPDLDGGLKLNVPRSTIDVDLVVEDAKIYSEFECTYFQLPFLIQCINTFTSERIHMERLPNFNYGFRITDDNSTQSTTLRPYHYTEA